MDLRRQIAIIRAWLPLLILSALLAGGAGFLVSRQLPKVYEAKAQLIVGQALSAANPDYTQLQVSQSLTSTYATIATTRPLLDAVIKQLGLDVTADTLMGQVSADAPPGSPFLTVTAQDVDPTRAATIANAVAAQLIAASPAIQGRQSDFQASIDADLKATQDQIDTTQARVDELAAKGGLSPAEEAELTSLSDRLASLRATYATLLSYSSTGAASQITTVDPAIPPTAPVLPRTALNTLLAAVLGLLIALGAVAVMEYLDDAVKDADQVLEVTGLSTLGTIGRMRGDRTRSEIYRLVTLLYPRSGVAEAYRTLRANVEFASVGAPMRTLLVTSSVPGEGKTVTAANLAVAYAQAGRRVLLVDADLRKPGVHLLFDLPNTRGFTTLLRSDDASLDSIAQDTEQDNLRVLTTGPLPPNPAELLGSQRMPVILERLKAGGDLIVFDSPPLQAVTDSAILSSYLDATLFVIHARHSRRRVVRLAREALAKGGGHVLGAVLNGVPARAKSDYADYYGGYGDSGKVGILADGSPDLSGPSTDLQQPS